MDTDTISLASFAAQTGIQMLAEWVASRPKRHASEQWDGSTHYRCVFRWEGRRMTVYFSMGSALRNPPTIEDVLDCLASDASGYENSQGFEDWASEYGYDTDSRAAERIYRAVGQETRKLQAFLGSDAYEQLLWHTERE